MDNPRFNLSDRFQHLGGIALALMFIMLSTASAWADTSPSLELKHAFGDNATVTFYLYNGGDRSEKPVPPSAVDISNIIKGGAAGFYGFVGLGVNLLLRGGKAAVIEPAVKGAVRLAGFAVAGRSCGLCR